MIGRTDTKETTMQSNHASRATLLFALFLGFSPTLSAESGKYSVIFINDDAIRLDTNSGKSWYLVSDNVAWTPVKEEDEIAPGNYTVKLWNLNSSKFVIRLEQSSGQTWMYDDEDKSWGRIEVLDPAAERAAIAKMNAEELRAKAREYFDNQDYVAAKRVVMRVLSLHEPTVDDWNFLGDISYEGESEAEWQDGVLAYSMAIRLDPKNSYAYMWRGALYDNLEDRDRSEADRKRAMELGKDEKTAKAKTADTSGDKSEKPKSSTE